MHLGWLTRASGILDSSFLSQAELIEDHRDYNPELRNRNGKAESGKLMGRCNRRLTMKENTGICTCVSQRNNTGQK